MEKFRTILEQGNLALNREMEYAMEWLIVPVFNRYDSCVLDESNWKTALEWLGGEQKGKVEIHRFGHFVFNWIEYLVINPACKEIVEIAERIEREMEQYPVLDDDNYSAMEWDYVWNYCYDEIKSNIDVDDDDIEELTSQFLAQVDEISEFHNYDNEIAEFLDEYLKGGEE